MLAFPDPSVSTEYTDPNGSVWEFNGTGWVRQPESSGGGGGDISTDYVDILIVGGGGGGGVSSDSTGGGGGAGGVRFHRQLDPTMAQGGASYDVVIGGGGKPSSSTGAGGSASSVTQTVGGAFASTASGGGNGAPGFNRGNGGDGGSGGGMCLNRDGDHSGNAERAGYGNTPLLDPNQGNDGFMVNGGGATGHPSRYVSGCGLKVYDFGPEPFYVATGGAGGSTIAGAPAASVPEGGSGFAGTAPSNGAPNTGDGAGSCNYGVNNSQWTKSTVGGSGVVYFRSPYEATATTGDPVLIEYGPYKIYKFTGSGSITF